MIRRSPLPPVPLTGQTITEKLFEGLVGRREAVAMVDGPTGREATAGAPVDGIARLATCKLPRAIHVVETIPKSPSGKILRRMLPRGGS